MDYKVFVTSRAELDIAECLYYLLYEKDSRQAAQSILADYEDTLERLKTVADSLKICDNPKLSLLGYRRINFTHHNYFMMYRVEDDIAIVDRVFHSLQDYENKMK